MTNGLSGRKTGTSGRTWTAPALRLKVMWIISAWLEITPEMIRKSVKDCEIINACDGSEDDELFHGRVGRM